MSLRRCQCSFSRNPCSCMAFMSSVAWSVNPCMRLYSSSSLSTFCANIGQQPLSLPKCMHSRSVQGTQPHAHGGATPSAFPGSERNTPQQDAGCNDGHACAVPDSKEKSGWACWRWPDQQARLIRQPSGLVVQRVLLLAAGRRAHSCCIIQSTATTTFCLPFP